MVLYDTKECNYFRESPGDNAYQLLDQDEQRGLIINYQNVIENGQGIKMELICDKEIDFAV